MVSASSGQEIPEEHSKYADSYIHGVSTEQRVFSEIAEQLCTDQIHPTFKVKTNFKCMDEIGDINTFDIYIRKSKLLSFNTSKYQSESRREHMMDKLDKDLADMKLISERLDALENDRKKREKFDRKLDQRLNQ